MMQRWYNYFSHDERRAGDPHRVALMDVEGKDIEKNNLMVCQQVECRYFTRFNTFMDFGLFMRSKVNEERRCFYEMIVGSMPQKPYFDCEADLKIDDVSAGNTNLDGSAVNSTQDANNTNKNEQGELTERKRPTFTKEEADAAIKSIIEAILTLIPEIRKGQGSILVFTSHSMKKRSYHIIVDGWSNLNFKENRAFHDEVNKQVPERWRDIIDHSMYKSLQQLRIVGCHKWQDNREKTLSDMSVNFKTGTNTCWQPPSEPRDANHYFMMLLGASLITNTTTCQMMKSYIPAEAPRKSRTTDSDETIYIDATVARQALELCANFAGVTTTDRRFPYKINKWLEPDGMSVIILLERIAPSFCRVCERIHENENPYLIISGNMRTVQIDCRRNADGKRLHVGAMGPLVQYYDPEQHKLFDFAGAFANATASESNPSEAKTPNSEQTPPVLNSFAMQPASAATPPLSASMPSLSFPVQPVAVQRSVSQPILNSELVVPIEALRAANQVAAASAGAKPIHVKNKTVSYEVASSIVTAIGGSIVTAIGNDNKTMMIPGMTATLKKEEKIKRVGAEIFNSISLR